MQPLIFISYLRATNSGWPQAIFERLQRSFTEDEIFFDREARDLPVGQSFRVPIIGALASCQIVLAIIEPTWRDIMVGFAKRRMATGLRKELPVVTMCEELSQAFTMHRPVLPLVIAAPTLPDLTGLPDSLGKLRDLDIVEIYPAYWHEAFDRLLKRIEQAARLADRRETEFLRVRERHSHTPVLNVIAGAMWTAEEMEMLRKVDPVIRGNYLREMRMRHTLEADRLLSKMQSMRNTNLRRSMELIGNIR
jgi:hypothetical protein